MEFQPAEIICQRLDASVFDLLGSEFTLEADLLVDMEDFETPVQLYRYVQDQANVLNCKSGDQVIAVKSTDNCFSVAPWFVFSRGGSLLAGHWPDTCAPETFYELAHEALGL